MLVTLVIFSIGVNAGAVYVYDVNSYFEWMLLTVKIVVFAVALFAVCSMICDFSQTKCVWLRVRGRMGGKK